MSRYARVNSQCVPAICNLEDSENGKKKRGIKTKRKEGKDGNMRKSPDQSWAVAPDHNDQQQTLWDCPVLHAQVTVREIVFQVEMIKNIGNEYLAQCLQQSSCLINVQVASHLGTTAVKLRKAC